MMPPPFDADPGNDEPAEPLTWREWCLALIVALAAIGALVFGPTLGAS